MEVVCIHVHFQVLADSFRETIRWFFINQYVCRLFFFSHYVSAFVCRYATLMLGQTQQALYIISFYEF
jgi:hypothetical protein